MYSPVPSAHLPARAAFLSRCESGVRTDTQTLRLLGVKSISHAFCGQEFLDLLGGASSVGDLPETLAGIEAVVCDEHLGDMPAQTFLLGLAALPAWKNMPVVVLVSSLELRNDFVAAGIQCLARPYAANDLGNALNRALSPLRSPLRREALEALAARQAGMHKKTKKASAKAAPPKTTTDLFTHGMQALQRNILPKAEECFREVLQRQDDNVEACIAMARIHRSRGEAARMQGYLVRAAAASFRMGDRKRADSITCLLPEHMRGSSIFMYEAIARMEAGEYKPAALSLLDACREYPNTQLHVVLARACQRTGNPVESIRKLCNAYDSMGHDVTARRLRQRLLHNPEIYYEDAPSWLDRFPRLKEAVCVASYTARAWRYA